MHRILFSLFSFFIVLFSIEAQPLTVHKKAKMNIHSDAHSLFTRFKDRFFSNYQYFDELKNIELHADVFSGFSLSLGAPIGLFGFNSGGNFILDYYLKEGLALRTGFGIKGYRLYRNVKLNILNEEGKPISAGVQVYKNRMTQVTIPLHLLFTKFRYNHGFWTSFGATFALNLAGHYFLDNKSNIPIPSFYQLPKPINVRAFAVANSSNKIGPTYFNRVSIYADVVIGYKFSRFLNFYSAIKISATGLQSQLNHNINNNSLNFGALISLWQY